MHPTYEKIVPIHPIKNLEIKIGFFDKGKSNRSQKRCTESVLKNNLVVRGLNNLTIPKEDNRS